MLDGRRDDENGRRADKNSAGELLKGFGQPSDRAGSSVERTGRLLDAGCTRRRRGGSLTIEVRQGDGERGRPPGESCISAASGAWGFALEIYRTRTPAPQ